MNLRKLPGSGPTRHPISHPKATLRTRCCSSLATSGSLCHCGRRLLHCCTSNGIRLRSTFFSTIPCQGMIGFYLQCPLLRGHDGYVPRSIAAHMEGDVDVVGELAPRPTRHGTPSAVDSNMIGKHDSVQPET